MPETAYRDPKMVYQVTSEPRKFSVAITDEFAKQPWNNEANDLVAEFREWLTGVKDDAQQHQQAGPGHVGSGLRSGDQEAPGNS